MPKFHTFSCSATRRSCKIFIRMSAYKPTDNSLHSPNSAWQNTQTSEPATVQINAYFLTAHAFAMKKGNVEGRVVGIQTHYLWKLLGLWTLTFPFFLSIFSFRQKQNSAIVHATVRPSGSVIQFCNEGNILSSLFWIKWLLKFFATSAPMTHARISCISLVVDWITCTRMNKSAVFFTT